MSRKGIPDGKSQSGLAGLALAFLLLIPGCGSLEGPQTCGTDVPDPTEDLVGCLVDERNNPVAGVTVQVIKKGAAAKPGLSADLSGAAAAETEISDRHGRFTFSGLAHGNYEVTAVDSLNRSLLPVKWTFTGDQLFLTKATLYRNGFLSAKVLDALDSTTLDMVTCDIPGHPHVIRTAASGELGMPLPPGTYSLRCELPLYAVVLVQNIEVAPQETTHVDVPMNLVDESKRRPPAPANIVSSYDSLTSMVRLSWNRVQLNQRQEIVYFVKRIDPTLQNPYTEYTTQDTFITNEVQWPQSDTGRVNAGKKTLTFNVATKLRNSNVLSDLQKLEIEVHPPVFLGPSVTLVPAGGLHEFTVGDTALLVGTFDNRFRANKRLVWSLETTRAELKPPRNLTETAGSDTLAFICAIPDTAVKVRLTVTDMGGVSASSILRFVVKAP